MTDILRQETRDTEAGRVEIWTLHRPEVLNALNSALIDALDRAAQALDARLQQDPLAVRALILQGAGGKAFVAGADIAEMRDFDAATAERFSRQGQRAFGLLETLPIPTIAAIEGFALGGGLELAMCCDLLVASPGSQFGQPEAFLGLIPGFGATARLPLRIGVARALELLYTGRRINSEEAVAYGLVQRIARDRAPLDEALGLVGEMKKSGPLALARVKQLVAGQARRALEAGLSEESAEFGRIFESADKREGVLAFLEKRKAQFKGC